MENLRRPRVLDIALEAGVSTATVDRVMNGRGGVSDRTVALVRQAEARLAGSTPTDEPQSRSALPHKATARTFDVVLPSDAGLSTDYLAGALRHHAERLHVPLRIRQIDRMNPEALATELRSIGRQGSGGVAFQALEHPTVLEAVAALRDNGVPVATVVSGISSSFNLRHVGLDNRGAGRTAALLLGSFLAGAGRIAVVWSGSLSRAHEERESGFRALLRDEFPNIELDEINIGRHEPVETLDKIRKALGENRTFNGAYCVGAGLASLIDAVSALPYDQRPTIVGHNLTEKTRDYLMGRSVTAIIHQDMMQIAEAVLKGLMDGNPPVTVTVPTIIVTRENLNHYSDPASLSVPSRMIT